MRRILALMAACIAATGAILAFAAPTLAASSPPAFAHHVAELRHGPVPGTEFNTLWSGYIDHSASGKTFQSITGSILVPGLECGDTKIGSSGNALTDAWVGISSGPGNPALAQDGLELFCTGTPGHFATCGNCGVGVWFYECCTGKLLTFFSVPSDQIVPGNALTFRTSWLPDATNCGQTGCYQFVVWWNGLADHQTKYLPCYPGLVCGASNTAEAITEAPGGENLSVTPLVEWNPTNGVPPFLVTPNIQYDVTSVQSNDATGNLFPKTGEWTLNTVINSPTGSLPQVMIGDPGAVGQPGALQSDGSGGSTFVTDCGVELADTSFHPCPYGSY